MHPCMRGKAPLRSLALVVLSALAAAGGVAEDWQHSLHHLSALRYENQRLPDMLGSMMNYKFTFPETALRKGVAYLGSNFRLRRVMHELLRSNAQARSTADAPQQHSARPIKIALLGGSISWGTGASERGVTDWFSIFSRWMIESFPAANVTLRNGCVPATPSAYMVLCLEMSMDEDADLVFVEYALNDGFENEIKGNGRTKIYERLMRRILAKPHNPAVVLMQVLNHGMANMNSSNGEEYQPFHGTQEDSYGALAQYYDLQYLSFRTAIYRLAAHKRAAHYTWQDVLTKDLIHPSDGGFRLMAELAIWLLQQTAIDLLLRPFGHADVELLEDTLPLPMEEGNEAPRNAMCLYQDALRQVVNSTSGFLFVNEGTEEKPKKGFVATTPGSTLTILLNTWRGGDDTKVSVFLAYLKSYVRMGQAVARCESGCQCEERVLEGHHAERQSQMFLAALQVTQNAPCVVSLTVLANSTSRQGGHKFKLGGVMVTEQVVLRGRAEYQLHEGKFDSFAHENPELQLTYSKSNAGGPKVEDPVDSEDQIKQQRRQQAVPPPPPHVSS